MDKFAGQKRTPQYFYPPLDPFSQQIMETRDGHRIYVEQCGHREGQPVVVLHGGPGGGCSPVMRRYFDPKKFRIILFDQRGCGRSRPTASVKDNTTWHLISDIEMIRNAFSIEKWAVFGGSWGATLSLLYAQAHPERVSHLILRGVFLMMQRELNWFYGGGAGQFWPDTWARFVEKIPQDERDDLIGAYHRRLFSGDMRSEMQFGRLWSAWENALASIYSNGHGGDPAGEYSRTFARLENHYFINKGFLDSDTHILDNMNKIANIPGYIVQGRYDMICPPQSAWAISKLWPKADLRLVRNAGHAMSEPGISSELVKIMDQI